jgi:NAD(P)-dependent dehydrogenase (short-subunit alcohol dehydrogenase family)
MRGVSGKRYIIGGGATGMGAALAERLVDEGASVVVGDINRPAVEALVDGLTEKRGKAVASVFDLADVASIERLIETCVTRYGGIDGVAITGADLSKETLGNDRDILHMDTKVWERTLTVNLMGHVHLMRLAIPYLTEAGGGSIVSVSSAAVYFGHPHIPAYSASKAGLHTVVRHVARICGKDNIRCNAIAPGLVVTEGAKVNLPPGRIENALKEYASHRLGEADDIASAALFLLSDESQWITGQILSVNGGYIFRD